MPIITLTMTVNAPRTVTAWLLDMALTSCPGRTGPAPPLDTRPSPQRPGRTPSHPHRPMGRPPAPRGGPAGSRDAGRSPRLPGRPRRGTRAPCGGAQGFPGP
ncbi:hypothetical protein JCM13210_12010 [Thermaerobacter litoralis]